jgi:hypothetical protein
VSSLTRSLSTVSSTSCLLRQLHALSEVQKSRVVANRGPRRIADTGERSRARCQESQRQGLVRKTELSDTAHNPTRVVSLTKEGHKLLFRRRSLPPIRPSHLVLLADSTSCLARGVLSKPICQFLQFRISEMIAKRTMTEMASERKGLERRSEICTWRQICKISVLPGRC